MGKSSISPRQFTPAGLLFQMAGRHTHYFRACAVCLHFLLGNAQVFLGGVYRVHVWPCAHPLHGRNGGRDSLVKWLWALPRSDRSPTFAQRSLLQSRARWSEEGRHKHFSPSLLWMHFSHLCVCAVCFDFFLRKKKKGFSMCFMGQYSDQQWSCPSGIRWSDARTQLPLLARGTALGVKVGGRVWGHVFLGPACPGSETDSQQPPWQVSSVH